MNHGKNFIVEPGSKLRLAKIDASMAGALKSRKKAAQETARQIERIDRLQNLLIASADQSLLIVLQALDGAGKDGVIRHLFSGMNPQGTSVFRFAPPSKLELRHDFLWRAHARSPGNGQVVIFNRSHYEDVLAVRVRKLVPRSVWSKRYDLINYFEKTLAENRTRILKFYLHISPDEQLLRFKQRLDDPARQWKISESDYDDRELWPKYIEAYEEAIEKTSTRWAPWYVVPANHKWFRNFVISKVIADCIDDMNLRAPPPTVDISEIRRKYHAAEQRSFDQRS